jgi:hypothetical protein
VKWIVPVKGSDELADEADKGDQFGVGLHDILASPFENWKANGMKNPYGVPKTSDNFNSAQLLPYQQGVRSAGVFTVPVCSLRTVIYNIDKRWRAWDNDVDI